MDIRVKGNLKMIWFRHLIFKMKKSGLKKEKWPSSQEALISTVIFIWICWIICMSWFSNHYMFFLFNWIFASSVSMYFIVINTSPSIQQVLNVCKNCSGDTCFISLSYHNGYSFEFCASSFSPRVYGEDWSWESSIILGLWLWSDLLDAFPEISHIETEGKDDLPEGRAEKVGSQRAKALVVAWGRKSDIENEIYIHTGAKQGLEK